MITSENEEVFGVLDLVREQQADGFERLFASVNVVAEEEVISFGWEAAIFEQAKQIVVLTVDIATYLGF